MARKSSAASNESDLSDMPELDPATVKIVRRGPLPGERRRLTLATLRGSLDLTQTDVAERAGITQSEISRAESREDCLVSTLQRYAKALGGELEVVIRIKGREYPVVLTS